MEAQIVPTNISTKFSASPYQHALPADLYAIVDKAQFKGIIDHLQSEKPVEAVHGVVQVEAVNALIAVVTRLIFPFQ